MTFSSKTLLQGLAFSACSLQGADSVALRSYPGPIDLDLKHDKHNLKLVHSLWNGGDSGDVFGRLAKLLGHDHQAELFNMYRNPNNYPFLLKQVRQKALDKLLLSAREKLNVQTIPEDMALLAASLIIAEEKHLDVVIKDSDHENTSLMARLNLANIMSDFDLYKSELPKDIINEHKSDARKQLEFLLSSLYDKLVLDNLKHSWGSHIATPELQLLYRNSKLFEAAVEKELEFSSVGLNRNSQTSLVDLYVKNVAQQKHKYGWHFLRSGFKSTESLRNLPFISLDDAEKATTETMLRFLLQRKNDDHVKSNFNFGTVNRFTSLGKAYKLTSIFSKLGMASVRVDTGNEFKNKSLADLVLFYGVKIVLPMQIALLQMVRDYNGIWSKNDSHMGRKNKKVCENRFYSWIKGYALALSNKKELVEKIVGRMLVKFFLNDGPGWSKEEFMTKFIGKIETLISNDEVDKMSQHIFAEAQKMASSVPKIQRRFRLIRPDRRVADLFEAAKEGDEAIARLTGDGANIDEQNREGNTALHLALLEDRNGDAAKRLRERGAKTDIKNNFGNTPDHYEAFDDSFSTSVIGRDGKRQELVHDDVHGSKTFTDNPFL